VKADRARAFRSSEGSATTPFARKPDAPAVPAPPPRLPLQAYAALCAELAVAPERAAELLRKYSIGDESARRALDDECSRFANRVLDEPSAVVLFRSSGF
jgi:hypothetical protein